MHHIKVCIFDRKLIGIILKFMFFIYVDFALLQ